MFSGKQSCLCYTKRCSESVIFQDRDKIIVHVYKSKLILSFLMNFKEDETEQQNDLCKELQEVMLIKSKYFFQPRNSLSLCPPSLSCCQIYYYFLFSLRIAEKTV